MFKTLPETIKIIEVGPRDGLQNEKQSIALDTKRTLITMLEDAGLKTIEAGSFVSPKWVPQMADTAALLQSMEMKTDIAYPVLVPNIHGLERALEHGVKDIAVFGAASEGFTQKNINCSIAESLERFTPVCDLARQENLNLRGYVSCVLGCPYDGEIAPEAVQSVADALFDMGCTEISLGDTIGVGTALKTQHMLNTVLKSIPRENIAVHFHDTYGQALSNILVSIENGITAIDSAVAGLGGCPYAKGASGNVATEDVVYMLNGMGIKTGIDLDKLYQAGLFISNVLGHMPSSKVSTALSGQSSR